MPYKLLIYTDTYICKYYVFCKAINLHIRHVNPHHVHVSDLSPEIRQSWKLKAAKLEAEKDGFGDARWSHEP